MLLYFKQSKSHNTKITQAVYLQPVSHIIMIIIALNDIIAFPNLDLTFDNPCANWSLKALLCNNLSHRNKGSPIMAARLPSWIAFASVKRTTVVSHLVWKSDTNYAQATMERLNHKKSLRQGWRNQQDKPEGNAALNRKKRTYGCSTLWTQIHLERRAVFLAWVLGEAPTGMRALMTDSEGVMWPPSY